MSRNLVYLLVMTMYLLSKYIRKAVLSAKLRSRIPRNSAKSAIEIRMRLEMEAVEDEMVYEALASISSTPEALAGISGTL